MNEEAIFEGQNRRMQNIIKCLQKNGIENLQEAKKLCNENNISPEKIVKSIQPIAFENAVWAYTLGCAVAGPGPLDLARCTWRHAAVCPVDWSLAGSGWDILGQAWEVRHPVLRFSLATVLL